MPVMSYLVHPVPQRDDDLRRELAALGGCTVLPAETGSLLLLVTETPDDAAEEALQERLRGVDSLAFLSLVFAHRDEAAEDAAEPPGAGSERGSRRRPAGAARGEDPS